MPTVGAYVDDDLYAKAKQIADQNGITVSAMVKQALTDATITDTRPKIELLHEMKRIGNNLNQIAKRANTYGVVDRAVLSSLLLIEQEIAEIRRSL